MIPIVVGIVLLFVAIALASLMPGTPSFSIQLLTVYDWLKNSEISNLFRVIAIVVGSIWVYFAFIRTRQKYPRANIRLAAKHWSVSDSEILLRVTITLSNVGDVLLSLVSGEIWVQLVKPWPSKMELNPIRKKCRKVQEPSGREEEDCGEGKWDIKKEIHPEFRKGFREIEPGETDELCYDFLLDSSYEIVLLYAHLKNRTKRWQWCRLRLRRREIGWNSTLVYELRPAPKETG